MCGISGIVNQKNKPVISQEIEMMNNQIVHRGPDGFGFYFGANFAFGHRRLSILDLSEDGKQPMEYHSDLVITYNGEIYNYIELKSELEALGCTFKSKTDTEVILAAYQVWGEKCVSRFNGMWSFAIYDRKENLLFCSRDRFGVKPFYFTQIENNFAFGSEIKQLLSFLPAIKCNRQLLLDYLVLGIEEHTQGTFFEGIQKLQGGHNLVYDLEKHTFHIYSYYNLQPTSDLKQVTEERAVEMYKEQLYDSVKLRMRSDVEVGTCLSGGLDSSSITAFSAEILRKETEAKIKAIHAKVDDKTIDESDFAKQVSNFCDTDLILVEPTVTDFQNSLEKVIQIQEEPFGSPSIILQYFVLQKARENNCLVMLDGQGGDETLLGYERYYPAFILKQKGWKKVNAFLSSSKNSRLSKMELLKYYFYFTKYRFRINQLKKRHNYIKKSILDGFESPVLKESAARYLDIEAMQKLEILKTQLPHLLKYEDKNSMSNSVETRLPFLDYRCVELALALPDQYKINAGWTKNILRHAMDSWLPKEVVWRKDKLGFNAPEKNWLQSMQKEMQNSILNSALLDQLIDKEKFQYSAQDLRTQWRLFNIAKWEQIYKVEW
jgi:asparagine synthase (glutamine-hydrolysing)